MDARSEALEVAAEHLGRPTALVEKDIYVVWALAALERAPFAGQVVFKGGTSLSKAYRLIDRFSEDVDLTYDIRALAPDLVADGTGDGWPRSRSQANTWASVIQQRLAAWLQATAAEHFRSAAHEDGVSVEVEIAVEPKRNQFDLHLRYERTAAGQPDYVRPSVKLEFGARGTGEPHRRFTITTDAAATPALTEVTFPRASVATLTAERTFWEKATAAHVYCVRTKLRSARAFARHWYDLVRLQAGSVATKAVHDRSLALEVARWKSLFFHESGVDYDLAVNGHLRLVPTNHARDALRDDYDRMVEAGLLHAAGPTFDEILTICADLETLINDSAKQSRTAR